MLRNFALGIFLLVAYLLFSFDNSDKHQNVRPQDELLKIRDDINQLLEGMQNIVEGLREEKHTLHQEVLQKSVLEFKLKWRLFYSENNARILQQKLYQSYSEVELIIDPSYHFVFNLSSLQHPEDSTIVDLAEEIVQRVTLDRTLCRCPHLENYLDCVELPEFSYFGTVCEPILWVPFEENQPYLSYPEANMTVSTHGLCFALPYDATVIPKVELLRYRDVYIDPLSGVIFDRNKNAVFDHFQMKSLWQNLQTEVTGVVKVKRVISFVQVWGDSYYHYINEFLTRLAFSRDFLMDNLDIKILLHNPQPFINESLQLLGLSTDRLLPYNFAPGTFYVAQELYYVASLPSPGFSAYHELLQLMHSSLIPMDQPKKDYILLVNDNPSVRAIENYRELKLAIKDNFPELHIVEHSSNAQLSESIKLWNSAKIVIGAHGESLTNLVWCSPNTTVIEFLHTGKETYGHYYWIANSMNLAYWVVPIHNATIETNYTIPIQKVLNILQKTH